MVNCTYWSYVAEENAVNYPGGDETIKYIYNTRGVNLQSTELMEISGL